MEKIVIDIDEMPVVLRIAIEKLARNNGISLCEQIEKILICCR